MSVVLTHTTADFDSLASAVGLAKVWAAEGHADCCVVLPRGAHPNVAEYLALHRHLFPIRPLKELTSGCVSGSISLERLGMVDCQRRDRIGPAAALLAHAARVSVIDHHADKESDVGADDILVEHVGSVSTIVAELLQAKGIALTDAEATLMALGVHADTGSLTFDSACHRDALALAWLMAQGASQAAVNDYSKGGLSAEQAAAMMQAFGSMTTVEHNGLQIATAVAWLPNYVNGLARVAQDLLELGTMDVLLLAGAYASGSSSSGSSSSGLDAPGGGHNHGASTLGNNHGAAATATSKPAKTKAVKGAKGKAKAFKQLEAVAGSAASELARQGRLQESLGASQGSALLEKLQESQAKQEAATAVAAAVAAAAVAAAATTTATSAGAGAAAAGAAAGAATTGATGAGLAPEANHHADTLIVVGRVRSRVNKAVNLNAVFAPFGGGGHPKAAACTVKLSQGPRPAVRPPPGPTEAGPAAEGSTSEVLEAGPAAEGSTAEVLAAASAADDVRGLLATLVAKVKDQHARPVLTAGDCMTAPVLTCAANDPICRVEKVFRTRFVHSLPVVDPRSGAIVGMLSLVELAKLRAAGQLNPTKLARSAMVPLSRVPVVVASTPLAEVEAILLAGLARGGPNLLPVIDEANGQPVGILARTDLLRQRSYYKSLHYHNKGFADSLADRATWQTLRKQLKRFDGD